MIKLSQLEEKAMQEAFNEEFIKLAQGSGVLKLLLKGLGWIGKNFKISGKLERFSNNALKALKEGKIKQFMQEAGENKFLKMKDGSYKVVGNPEESGFLGSRFADSYNYLGALSKGVKDKKGFVQKAKKALSNFGSEEIQQYRNQTFRIVDTNKPAMFGKSKHVVENGVLRGQGFMPDRKIVQDLGNGRYMVKKRLPIRLLGYTMTPTGMLASGMLLGDSPYNSASEALKWTPATKLVGEVSAAASGASAITSMF